MRILVYPHDLNMGGSQTNAIELAAAVKSLGHECIIFGRPGTLLARIEELGLEFIESPPVRRRPSIRVARTMRDLVIERGIDVIHGYEWPPGLEALMATSRLPQVAAVCTVMSMAVAPFLPRTLPLVVGTPQISASEQVAGRQRLHVIEPPVDLVHNQAPSPAELASFRSRWNLDERPLVVCVSRLANELKSEGILTAIDVAGDFADVQPFQLLIVGDGAARGAIQAAADEVNRRTRANTVIVTGELADPRAAYAAADVTLGMGSSALRSLAFGKPLVVQGEKGFFATLGPQTVDTFRWQGWYGVGQSSREGRSRLAAELEPLLADPAMRRELGAFGRNVVEAYSLDSAARRQVAVYRDALAGVAGVGRDVPEVVRSGASFSRYYLGRRISRVLGRQLSEDFNANPVAATTAVSAASADVFRSAAPGCPGPLVYFSGADWDAMAGSDRLLVGALARSHPVIWIDSPRSIRRSRDQLQPVIIAKPHPNITRLSVLGPPGLSRPVIRAVAHWWALAVLRWYLSREQLQPSAVIVSSPAPVLPALRKVPGRKVYFATDDFVEAASIWGVRPHYLRRSREANLGAADLVLAVTPALARHLQRGPVEPFWFPNGTDVDHYRGIDDADRAKDIRLVSPIAGVVGQFNERTDFEALRAVQSAGISLLLVGPDRFRSKQARTRFLSLAALPGVQWVGKVPRDALPGYLRSIDVGLTPYADTAFNRRSYPLKTVEYLAAGVPVVSTDVAPLDGFDPRFVSGASTPEGFVEAISEMLDRAPARSEIQQSIEGNGWDARASRLLEWLGETRTTV
ncbi:glycosyltransferase [Mycetocola miduiensis]|uniref:Glycosyltransferase involved in cell wall bisynthesis n=1 Tax=Mycetocola miduiensis TaxID=995034 RepID=A0A1I5B865_9MICO|nr:glycosyltransferase [Mycetocola miduiensis]SFN70903.1 Glycosyltransferase involved in cell wall bisynthesis [Mycetocola miduiensis]